MRGLKFIILGVAVVAGVGAVALVQSELKRAHDAAGQQERVVETEIAKSKILVAKRDMARGHPMRPEDLEWREWPEEMGAETYINSASRPDAVSKAGDFMVKSAMVAGEPVTDAADPVDAVEPGDVPDFVDGQLRAGECLIPLDEVGAEERRGRG